jgi:hypothetical protein
MSAAALPSGASDAAAVAHHFRALVRMGLRP